MHRRPPRPKRGALLAAPRPDLEFPAGTAPASPGLQPGASLSGSGNVCGVSDGYCPRCFLLHRQAPRFSASDTTGGWRSWIRTSTTSSKGSRPPIRRSSTTGAAGWVPTSALAVRSGPLLPLSYGGVWCARSELHRDLLVFSQTRRLTTPQAHVGPLAGAAPATSSLPTRRSGWLSYSGSNWYPRPATLRRPPRCERGALLAELRGFDGRAAWICTRVSCVSDTCPTVGRRLDGSSGRVRSCNLPVNSRALYQLSY